MGPSQSRRQRPQTCHGRAPRIVPTERTSFEHSYGLPLRPGTPIKAVLGNFYGEIAGYQHKVRKEGIEMQNEEENEKILNPPRTHTRATAMANSYVNEAQKSQMKGTGSVFKMR